MAKRPKRLQGFEGAQRTPRVRPDTQKHMPTVPTTGNLNAGRSRNCSFVGQLLFVIPGCGLRFGFFVRAAIG
jgi:hypothetical protein